MVKTEVFGGIKNPDYGHLQLCHGPSGPIVVHQFQDVFRVSRLERDAWVVERPLPKDVSYFRCGVDDLGALHLVFPQVIEAGESVFVRGKYLVGVQRPDLGQ
jgi:hypothetical protein